MHYIENEASQIKTRRNGCNVLLLLIHLGGLLFNNIEQQQLGIHRAEQLRQLERKKKDLIS
jgi:hypothetical protein